MYINFAYKKILVSEKKKRKEKKPHSLCLLGSVCFKTNSLSLAIHPIVTIIMVMNILTAIIFILNLINIVTSIAIFFFETSDALTVYYLAFHRDKRKKQQNSTVLFSIFLADHLTLTLLKHGITSS